MKYVKTKAIKVIHIHREKKMERFNQKKRSMTIEQRPVEIKLKGRDGHKDYLKNMLINRL